MTVRGKYSRLFCDGYREDLDVKHSIQVRLMIVLILFAALFMTAVWIVNRTFLTNYYQWEKLTEIEEVYQTLEETYHGSDEMNRKELEEAAAMIDRLCENSGIKIYVFNLYHIYTQGNYPLTQLIYPSTINLEQISDMEQKIRYYIAYQNQEETETENKEILTEEKQYGIYKVMDSKIGSYYLELFGTLSNGSSVYVRMNYQQMQDSSKISNKFLFYVGMLILLLASVVMFFISRSITKPIKQLDQIARKMTKLDFDVKYQEKRKDELGTLGNSINQLSDSLEKKISELKTANNELKKDIARKEQIDEMRKEFLSNVSHELKTPIALIQGYAEGLKENVTDDEESRAFYCDVIVDEANKMNQMVKKLLSLNQLEFGTTPMELERFDLSAVIRSVLTSFQILAGQKQAQIINECEDNVYAWADEYWVEEVIQNYVSNALNHLDGERKVILHLERKASSVRVCVFNTGVQIPEEELDKIWMKFYKVDKARTREYGGNGIGLSIVKAVMEGLNQEYGVINREDGVEFYFELDKNPSE